MDTSLAHAITRLPKGRLLRIPDAHGKGIAVFDGFLWITQQGDSRDFFVRAGETFTFDAPGLAVVQAFDDSQLIVFQSAVKVEPIGYEAAWPPAASDRSALGTQAA
ncbi:MAG TPA: DUF2917 domain-containing protein [Burkholderiaceae bacterium]|nr:DUF2917 domain-containing protein [Burkholderiaceae bacterium]